MQALCTEYDLPYTTGPLYKQYGQVLRTVMRLSLPNRWTGLPEQPEPVAQRPAADPAQALPAAA